MQQKLFNAILHFIERCCNRQDFEPFLHLSPQLLHLAPVLYFQVHFELFQVGIAVSTDLCVETAFHCDKCNVAPHPTGFGSEDEERLVWACSQCHRGVNVFTGYGGSLQNSVIDAAVIVGTM